MDTFVVLQNANQEKFATPGHVHRLTECFPLRAGEFINLAMNRQLDLPTFLRVFRNFLYSGLRAQGGDTGLKARTRRQHPPPPCRQCRFHYPCIRWELIAFAAVSVNEPGTCTTI